MTGRAFRHSLAIRLTAMFGGIFAIGMGLLFGLLYWRLAAALEQREHADVVRRTEAYATAYEFGGLPSLRAQLSHDQDDPAVRSLFVRIVGRTGQTNFAKVPPEWLAEQSGALEVPPGWSGWPPRSLRTVRVPRDAQRDLAIASRRLRDGSLLQVARGTDRRAVVLRPLRHTFALAGAAILIAAVLVGAFVARRSTAPLRAVTGTARRIVATGDLAERVPQPRGEDEVAELTRNFNSLLDKNSSLIRALRETHDDLAHDLRTPLARLRGTAELALRQADDPNAMRDALADCVEESERVLHLLETLLDVSAAESGALALAREPIDLSDLAREAADLYAETADERRITVEVRADAPAPVMADRIRLGQVVANLLDNAIKYTLEGGRVLLEVQPAGAHGARLTITDTGPGIDPAEQNQIWRRLYRGDASRSQRGLGLGLSVVKAVVEAHGGTVNVDPGPEGGARFTVQLPG